MELWHEREEAVAIRINYDDFTGSARQWQELYFQVLSWKNTWGLAYKVDMCAYHDNSPYVIIVAKREVKERIIDWLECIGYHKISSIEDVIVGTCEVYGDEDIYEYYLS